MIKQSRPTILLTRPAAQSRRFADELVQQFGPMDCVISPLLVPQFLPAPPAPPAPAVIFTSETGVQGAAQAGIWAQHGPPKTAFCVGSRTAMAARAQGFAAIDAKGDWRDLVHLVLAHGPAGDITFACAAEAPAHVHQALGQVGYKVHRRDVYCQNPAPLTAAALGHLAGAQPVLLPLFSPRSADLFCTAAAFCTAPLWIAALSGQISAAFRLPFAKLAIAHRPNSAALLDCIGALLQNLHDLDPNP